MVPRLSSLAPALVCALLLAACSVGSGTTTTSGSRAAASNLTGSSTLTTQTTDYGQLSYEGVPLESGPALGPPLTPQTTPVDKIDCGPVEQLSYHIHVHLAVFDKGVLYSLPAGIGIPGSVTDHTQQGPVAAGGRCIYWLHTHAPDGIVHIESPSKRIFHVGDFFDIWHQPLSSAQVGRLHGKVTAFLNGQLWTHPIRNIPLIQHAMIQFNIGEPSPPMLSINWGQTGL